MDFHFRKSQRGHGEEIHGRDRFAVVAFSAKDSLDIASRTTIDVTLASLCKDGKIRRIRRGLYDMPKINPALGGKLSPDIDEAARAIARRQRLKIVPEGAWAANLLGLSTQVSSKIIYLTDGPNTRYSLSWMF